MKPVITGRLEDPKQVVLLQTARSTEQMQDLPNYEATLDRLVSWGWAIRTPNASALTLLGNWGVTCGYGQPN
jgi:hypothetical protein